MTLALSLTCTFESPQAEIDFWKQKYEETKEELDELEEAFSEFQTSSKELEAVMESELEMNEKKLKEVTSQFNRMKTDHEDAMDKSRRITEDSGKMIHRLQEETESLRTSTKDLKKEKQKLEQENDNLERKLRETDAAYQDLSEKMNRLLEENAHLQTELEEKNRLNQETIQRLKDDIRDLRLELSLSDKKADLSDLAAAVSKLDSVPSEEEKVSKERSAETSPEMPHAQTNGKHFGNAGSLGLVNDILFIVKDMQQRLHEREKANSPLVEDSDSTEEQY